MKFNIAYPENGTNKKMEIVDPVILNNLYGLRIASEIEGGILDPAYNGYVFKITGGNDKQGFTMKQGVLTNTRVRLLLRKGNSCFRERRKGERKRKSVRGCEVGPDISVLQLVVIQTGDNEIEGLTDTRFKNRLGPKRATRIRKLFGLTKDDNPRDFVVCRLVEKTKDGVVKKRYKKPKIQRLVTPARLNRKRQFLKLKKQRIQRKKEFMARYKSVKAKKKAAEAV